MIEVRFLAVVRSAFGSISDDFTAPIKSASFKRNKSLNRFLIRWILFSKVRICYGSVGDDGA
jgi:hypothetical protein